MCERAAGHGVAGAFVLGLGVVTAGGFAVLFLAAFALVSGHGGVLRDRVDRGGWPSWRWPPSRSWRVAWIARRLWLRGAWLEALPLLVGLPWLSRVLWAVRVLWTGRAVWRLRNRVPSRRRDLSGFGGPGRRAGSAVTSRAGSPLRI